MTPDDPRRMDRLNRYLDDLARGAPPPPDAVESDLAATVDLLRRHDDAPAANPAFADRLLEDLMHAAGQTWQPGAAPIGGRARSPNGAVPARPRTRPSLPMPSVRRAWPLAQLATAAMLVLTLAGVAIAFGLLRTQEEGPIFVDSPIYRGGPARTGEQPGPGPNSTPTERWRVETDGRTAPTPVLADGVLYFGGDDGVLWAVDAETGAERWRFTAAAAIGAPPAVSDGTVYVGDRTGMLYALDAETGTPRWQINVLTPAESATFNASSWTYSISPVEIDGVVVVASGEGPSAPAVADGMVVVPAASVSLVRALDAATGAPIWRYPASENTAMKSQAGIFAIDAATGQQRWYFGTNSQVFSTPAIADGVVYIGSQKAGISAIDLANGTARWIVRISDAILSPSPALSTNTSPAIVDGVLYVGGIDENLYALDPATGQELWRSPVGRIRSSSSVVADGLVYVVADSVLHAIDAETGAERWQVELGRSVDGSAIVAGGLVFVGMMTEEGKAALVALG
jgi:outer membrane protein assembly factor BamB